MNRSSSKGSSNAIASLFAVLLFLIAGSPTLALFPLTYLLSVVVLSRTSRLPKFAVGIAATVAGLLALGSNLDFLENDQLEGMGTVLSDRRVLLEPMAMFPRALRGDRPQTIYVRDDDATWLEALLPNARVRAMPFGEGLFRIDYDPKKHGWPNVVGGRASIDLASDQTRRTRVVEWFPPRFRPTAGCSAPDRAFVVSEPTDQLIEIRSNGSTQIHDTADEPSSCIVRGETVWIGHRRGPVRTLEAPLPFEGSLVAITSVEGSTVTVTASEFPEFGLGIHWAGQGDFRIPLDQPTDFLQIRSAESKKLELLLSRRFQTELVRMSVDLSGPNPKTTILASTRIGRRPLSTVFDGEHLLVSVTDDQPRGAGANHAVDDQVLELEPMALRRARKYALKASLCGTEPCPRGALPIVSTGPSGRFVVTTGHTELIQLDPEPRAMVVAGLPEFPSMILDLGGTLLVGSSATGKLALVDVKTSSARPIETPEVNEGESLGEQVFYEATRKGVACATCHVASDSDFGVHDIGHGEPRPTLSTRGVFGTSPYLRGASYPSAQSFHQVSEEVLGGFERRLEGRYLALERYLSFLVPEPSRPISEVSAKAGVAAFLAAGCADCHSFPAFTRLSQVSQGELFPSREAGVLLDVPSLLGVAHSVPYLWDARAKSLTEVLEESGSHGHVDRLDSEQRSALLTLIGSL